MDVEFANLNTQTRNGFTYECKDNLHGVSVCTVLNYVD